MTQSRVLVICLFVAAGIVWIPVFLLAAQYLADPSGYELGIKAVVWAVPTTVVSTLLVVFGFLARK